MANLKVLDGDGAPKYISKAGTGTDLDPFTEGATPVTDNGGSLTVDGTVTLGAGTAAFGKLAANTGVDIGDVDVLSVAGNVTVVQATGTNLHAVVDSGTITTVSTVTAVTNVVHVDDNNGALTVDGAVTANAGTNLNTSALALETGGNLAAVKTNTDKIPALGQALMAASVPVAIASNQGAVPIADNGGSLTVDNGGTFAVQASIAAAQTLATVTTVGAVTAITNALPAGTNNIGDVDVLTLPASTNTLEVVGDVAADVAVAGNPVLVGVRGANAFPAAMSTTGDATMPMSDLYGRLVTVNGAPTGVATSGVTAAIIDTTLTQVLAAAGASTYWHITAITVTNSHATVGTLVTLQDDNASPYKYWEGYACAAGGGFSITFDPPISGGQANGKVNAVCGTTGANVYVAVAGFKALHNA